MPRPISSASRPLAGKLEAAARATGSRRDLGYAHYFRGSARFHRRDRGAAESEFQAARRVFEEIGDDTGLAHTLLAFAAIPLQLDLNYDASRALYEQSLPVIRKTGDRKLLAIALGRLGECCHYTADYDRAYACASEAAAIFTELRAPGSAGIQYVDMAHVHTLRREYRKALQAMRTVHELLWSQPTTRRIALYLDLCVTYAAAMRRWEDAARLLAFVDAYRNEHAVPRSALPPWLTNNVERLSAHFSAQRLEELQREGETLALDDVPAIVERLSSGL